jgi:hypothetical protein
MLRHAFGFALANKGHDTRALQAFTSATATSSTGAIHRVVAGPVQGLLEMTEFVWLIVVTAVALACGFLRGLTG